MKKFGNRSRVLGIALISILALALWASFAFAEEEAQFVGVKKCKMCHNKAEVGAQYDKWMESKHSKAFEVLASDSAKKVAASLGIEDAQKSGKCLQCHSTVYHNSETAVTNINTDKDGNPRLTVEQGVSCESCHWAGSLYQKKKVMEDHDASVAAGMNPKPQESCVKCHNDKNPVWNPEKYTLKDGTKVGFDYDQAWDKIKHMIPKTEATGK